MNPSTRYRLRWALTATVTATIAVLGLTAPAAAGDSAPTTAAGYERMWAKVSAGDEWGGGDVSLSVAMPDGRVVWLYGDTLSRRNGLVRSSAIVQDGRDLHVSRQGEQVLPDDRKARGRTSVYWIEAAVATGPRSLRVTAAPMSTGTRDGWDFHRRNDRSRTGRLIVTRAGDVVFKRWTGWVAAPAPFADLDTPAPGHLTYEHRAHPWAALQNGQTLMTHANNWDLGGEFKMRGKRIDYAAYAPTFYAGTGVETRAAQ